MHSAKFQIVWTTETTIMGTRYFGEIWIYHWIRTHHLFHPLTTIRSHFQMWYGKCRVWSDIKILSIDIFAPGRLWIQPTCLVLGSSNCVHCEYSFAYLIRPMVFFLCWDIFTHGNLTKVICETVFLQGIYEILGCICISIQFLPRSYFYVLFFFS